MIYIMTPTPGQSSPSLCEGRLVDVSSTGALFVEGYGWKVNGYTGDAFDADGNKYTSETLRAALEKERAAAVWQELSDNGYLQPVIDAIDLLNRLLNGLETVPLLREIIKKIRKG